MSFKEKTKEFVIYLIYSLLYFLLALFRVVYTKTWDANNTRGVDDLLQQVQDELNGNIFYGKTINKKSN
ncbi:hypothetical protein AKO1_007439 [Acrasis kona]|uniref:Uncharacterized protein n=1 Tax=Acrasis kona TaxID=1008807 RepID=A0AAW2YS59_9EUKA